MADKIDYFVKEYVLPKGVLEYFEFISTEDHSNELHVNLEEINTVPIEHAGKRLKSKGFYDTKNIQDFPLRGKRVILRVKCRKWLDQDTGKNVKRDWDLVLQGTKLTKEFAGFLKEMDRD
jgi:hypothetical protein